MKERNVLYPPRPKLPRFRSHFPKTPANYGGKVDNHFLFRRQNECALRKVWPQSFDHRSCTKLHTIASRESNSNQGSPINKHSQHSHYFSPYRCMVHGVGFFAELLLKVGLVVLIPMQSYVSLLTT